MVQAKFMLDESLVQFLNDHQKYGFNSKSEVVRAALERIREDLTISEMKPAGFAMEDKRADNTAVWGVESYSMPL